MKKLMSAIAAVIMAAAALTSVSVSAAEAEPASMTGIYFVYGDMNSDGVIDPVDATLLLTGLNKNGGKKLSVDEANANLGYYFPGAVCAEAADLFDTGYITQTCADEILRYYSYHSQGEDPSDYLSGRCGELGFKAT